MQENWFSFESDVDVNFVRNVIHRSHTSLSELNGKQNEPVLCKSIFNLDKKKNLLYFSRNDDINQYDRMVMNKLMMLCKTRQSQILLSTYEKYFLKAEDIFCTYMNIISHLNSRHCRCLPSIEWGESKIKTLAFDMTCLKEKNVFVKEEILKTYIVLFDNFIILERFQKHLIYSDSSDTPVYFDICSMYLISEKQNQKKIKKLLSIGKKYSMKKSSKHDVVKYTKACRSLFPGKSFVFVAKIIQAAIAIFTFDISYAHQESTKLIVADEDETIDFVYVFVRSVCSYLKFVQKYCVDHQKDTA